MQTADMETFEIRPDAQGFILSGDKLGGATGQHLFPTVREAANYARLRAELLAGDSKLTVFHADGTIRAERIMPGAPETGLPMNTQATHF